MLSGLAEARSDVKHASTKNANIHEHRLVWVVQGNIVEAEVPLASEHTMFAWGVEHFRCARARPSHVAVVQPREDVKVYTK